MTRVLRWSRPPCSDVTSAVPGCCPPFPSGALRFDCHCRHGSRTCNRDSAHTGAATTLCATHRADEPEQPERPAFAPANGGAARLPISFQPARITLCVNLQPPPCFSLTIVIRLFAHVHTFHSFISINTSLCSAIRPFNQRMQTSACDQRLVVVFGAVFSARVWPFPRAEHGRLPTLFCRERAPKRIHKNLRASILINFISNGMARSQLISLIAFEFLNRSDGDESLFLLFSI